MNVVKFLIEKGVDIEKGGYGGMNPLHHAVLANQQNVIEALLEKEANVNTQDDLGFTPLHYACEKGVLTVFDVLVEHGADVNLASKSGCLPLHKASIEGHVPVLQRLKKLQVDIQVPDARGRTALVCFFVLSYISILFLAYRCCSWFSSDGRVHAGRKCRPLSKRQVCLIAIYIISCL